MFKKFLTRKTKILNFEIADWVILVAGIIVFVAISLWTITKPSIWFDEAFSAYLVNFNFLEIAKFTASDVHPPFYYWLLKIWVMFFGNSELALRSMSLLFASISIIFSYLLAIKLFNKKAARISLIFLVLSPMLVRYSQEARMYALVSAIALAATYVLTIAVNSKKRLPWIIYGILISVGMWTQYFTAIIWLAHWVWRAGVIRKIAQKGKFIKTFFSKQWIMAHVIAIVLYVPWMVYFARQLLWLQKSDFWIPKVTPDTLTGFISNTVYYKDINEVTGWFAVGLIAAIAIMSFLAIRVYKNLDDSKKQSYQLVASLAFAPVILLFAMSLPPLRPVFVDRYLIASSVGIALFIGVTLSYLGKLVQFKKQLILVIMMAGLMAYGVTNVWQMGNYNKTTKSSNDTRQIVNLIAENSDDNQPIIADTPYFFCEVFYYSTVVHPVYFIETGSFKSIESLNYYYKPEIKTKDLAAFEKSNQIFWYVGYSQEGKLDKPYSNWIPLKELQVKDTVSGKTIYRAIQYRAEVTN